MNPLANSDCATKVMTGGMAFPHAPEEWTPALAEKTARAEGVELTPDHWEAVRCLQEFFARHETEPLINMRDLHDALEEHFHARGGLRALYRMFPGGPIAQGSRIAGLKPPYLSKDTSFGSVS